MDTPRAYIIQLCSYIKSDADIAMHTNRNFGTSVKAKAVAQIRSAIPTQRIKGQSTWVEKEPYQGDKYRRQVDAIRKASAQLADAIKAVHG